MELNNYQFMANFTIKKNLEDIINFIIILNHNFIFYNNFIILKFMVKVMHIIYLVRNIQYFLIFLPFI